MYHSKETQKIKVVVYCSAQFPSLKGELLQSANLTNVRFGWSSVSFLQDPVMVIRDFQSIFHQVRVPVEDRDCDLCNLMSTADVNLKKWVSNDRLILDSTPERN